MIGAKSWSPRCGAAQTHRRRVIRGTRLQDRLIGSFTQANLVDRSLSTSTSPWIVGVKFLNCTPREAMFLATLELSGEY